MISEVRKDGVSEIRTRTPSWRSRAHAKSVKRRLRTGRPAMGKESRGRVGVIRRIRIVDHAAWQLLERCAGRNGAGIFGDIQVDLLTWCDGRKNGTSLTRIHEKNPYRSGSWQ